MSVIEYFFFAFWYPDDGENEFAEDIIKNCNNRILSEESDETNLSTLWTRKILFRWDIPSKWLPLLIVRICLDRILPGFLEVSLHPVVKWRNRYFELFTGILMIFLRDTDEMATAKVRLPGHRLEVSGDKNTKYVIKLVKGTKVTIYLKVRIYLKSTYYFFKSFRLENRF